MLNLQHSFSGTPAVADSCIVHQPLHRDLLVECIAAGIWGINAIWKINQNEKMSIRAEAVIEEGKKKAGGEVGPVNSQF